MTNRFLNPRTQYLTDDGKTLPNGEANFYENGTLVRKDTFKDVNEDSINANPVVLNGDGSIPNVFYSGTARMILTFDDGSGREQRFDIPNVGIAGDGSAFDIWVNIVEYSDGALVEGSDGEYYRSLQNNNTGNDPISSPTFWEQVSFLRTWNPNITYALGDGGVVGSDGKQYRSLQAANLNNDPVSSPTFWGVNNPFDQSLNEADDVVFNSVSTDTIDEESSGFGVTVDSVLLKDGGAVLTGIADLSAAGAYFGTAAAANLLDDYEEGTFTASLSSDGGSITLDGATNTMSFTKVGNVVHIRGSIAVTSTSSPTGGLDLTGLPFTSAELTERAERSAGAIYVLNVDAINTTQLLMIASSTSISIEEFTGTTTANMADKVNSNSQFTFDFSYVAV